MDGRNEKEKFITAPEDVLEPAEPFDDQYNRAESAMVRKTLRILETETGELYINPDAQHIGSMQATSSIFRMYSREIQALRQVVSLLMGIITGLLEQMPTEREDAFLGDHYKEILKYLENASWELALVNDPRVRSDSPG